MRLHRYLQLDVFADRIGQGNPLAVVFDAHGLDAAAMQALAAWMQLPETVFLLPADAPGADYRVRIFTPQRELDFAGHPSIGAAWAVLDARRMPPGCEAMAQQCGAGVLPLRVAHGATGPDIAIRTPAARELAVDAAATAPRLQAALAGLRRGALAPALWDNGAAWWLVELEDEAAVRGMRPDLPAIAALADGGCALGLAVFARAQAPGPAWVVRVFCPGDGCGEDPVTGSAQASIATALLQAGRLRRGEAYTASQGRELGRDGRVQVRVDASGAVWIGGRVQAVVRGTLEW